jgi:Icc-related predicted phosphoesterase
MVFAPAPGRAVSGVPSRQEDTMPTDSSRIRVTALADIHYGNTGKYPPPDFAAVTDEADVLLLCGDLTDHGLPEEARGLARELAVIRVPIIAVLGNHDFETGHQDEVRQIVADAGVVVLDGEATEVAGIGFAGVKGFAGGFGRHTLEPWGERAVKSFVQEAVNEALKLESALARLRTRHVFALLHYAPIQTTVEGEPPMLFPFLGCSRLEEPLNRYAVTAAFHGHAHRGTLEGQTQAGIPVYNVALPLLRRTSPDQPPVRRFDVVGDAESRDAVPPDSGT